MSIRRQEQGGKVEFSGPAVDEIIQQFLGAIEAGFECAAIVGRKFAGVEDHAGHVAAGGCAQVINALARL
jgi:hypothetical protein